ncbi:uncharacterized protein LOC111705251 isoform X2 [Eurytemora carolleeae]|uniref:uncharacterized protein LOC111705251 isoform X2 n=1 Tax=Eurytemora carolleeae TaxID=1294199 RepID=UPI000C775A5B|nr:uncharacterized protein LOC111705251 isoform X2 [Eurytemora carolleeae]|eukprot:XP_023333518.1 uncharacterized protein LOC111705251 isoform X2 [Eurytemora affinis]
MSFSGESLPVCEVKYIRKFLRKCVRIESEKGEIFEGVLLACDPVSQSCVLLTSADEENLKNSEIVIVPSVDWSKVEYLESSSKDCSEELINQLFLGSNTTLSSEELKERRNNLTKFLQSHSLTLEEQGIGSLVLVNKAIRTFEINVAQ